MKSLETLCKLLYQQVRLGIYLESIVVNKGDTVTLKVAFVTTKES